MLVGREFLYKRAILGSENQQILARADGEHLRIGRECHPSYELRIVENRPQLRPGGQIPQMNLALLRAGEPSNGSCKGTRPAAPERDQRAALVQVLPRCEFAKRRQQGSLACLACQEIL